MYLYSATVLHILLLDSVMRNLIELRYTVKELENTAIDF